MLYRFSSYKLFLLGMKWTRRRQKHHFWNSADQESLKGCSTLLSLCAVTLVVSGKVEEVLCFCFIYTSPTSSFIAGSFRKQTSRLRHQITAPIAVTISKNKTHRAIKKADGLNSESVLIVVPLLDKLSL